MSGANKPQQMTSSTMNPALEPLLKQMMQGMQTQMGAAPQGVPMPQMGGAMDIFSQLYGQQGGPPPQVPPSGLPVPQGGMMAQLSQMGAPPPEGIPSGSRMIRSRQAGMPSLADAFRMR